MSRRSFRFLHAADLHLDRQVSGLAEAPEHLLDTLIECPLLAAGRVFDAALNHDVDFAVLAGGVLDLAQCSPHELVFLSEQFQRLADRNIAVYWAEETAAASDCALPIQWPLNVRRLASGRNELVRHEIDGEPVCEIVVLSHPGELSRFERDVFRVAICRPGAVLDDLDQRGISYCALVGQSARSTPINLPRSIAHYPGSPQGRDSTEAGPRGCSLVAVDEQGQAQISFVACDVVRWHNLKLEMASGAGRAELERLLRQRTAEILQATPGTASLVHWTVRCTGSLFSQLRQGKLAAELQGMLRAEFGQRNPAAWTIGVKVELPEQLPVAWKTEESLRGDFIRLVDDAINNADQDGIQEPEPALSLSDAPSELLEAVGWNRLCPADEPTRRSMLGETAWLGAERLAPEDREP